MRALATRVRFCRGGIQNVGETGIIVGRVMPFRRRVNDGYGLWRD
jgi:hypothetical protein